MLLGLVSFRLDVGLRFDCIDLMLGGFGFRGLLGFSALRLF